VKPVKAFPRGQRMETIARGGEVVDRCVAVTNYRTQCSTAAVSGTEIDGEQEPLCRFHADRAALS